MISCLCMTYGRIPLLEEAVYSFLHQDFKDAEIVIVNDHSGNEVVLEHPNVRIFNVEKRFDTLGEKRNFGVDKCQGEIISVWDDDDIYLPAHLEAAAKVLKNREHFLPDRYFRSVKNKIKTVVRLYLHPGSSYRKSLWKRVGGYPHRTAAEDRYFDLKIKKAGHGVWNKAPIRDNQITHIHRHNTGFYKLSQLDWDNRWTEAENLVEGVGTVRLNPMWRRDYAKDAKDFLSRC